MSLMHLKPKSGAKGFSLLELIFVLLLMAILLGIATPQFGRMAELQRMKEAAATLRTLFDAERIAFIDQNAYLNLNALAAQGYVLHPDFGNSHPLWDYEINVAGQAFTIVAARRGSGFNGQTITLAGAPGVGNGGNFGGTHTLLNNLNAIDDI